MVGLTVPGASELPAGGQRAARALRTGEVVAAGEGFELDVDAEAAAFAQLGGWPAILGRLLGGGELSPQEAGLALGQILTGVATPAQVAAYVTALRAKGETVGEMTGMVQAMVRHATAVLLEGDVLDTCGTGGDRSSSINASTIAALVVAGAGVAVCKHGGRAASSAAGSADVLEALGVAIDLGPEGVARCVAEVGMGFCFAPRYHPAMRHAIPVRRELGIATVFNFLGPLANPARARLQVVGVSDPAMAPKMLGVLAANGARRAMVVHGSDGLDELSTTGPSQVLWFDAEAPGDAGAEAPGGAGDEARNSELELAGTIDGPGVRRMTVDPVALGLAPATLADLRGGDAQVNAAIIRAVLDGHRGPHRDFVLLNAAAGFLVAGVVPDLASGVARAASSIDDGHARGVLDQLVEVSRAARRDEQP